MYINTKQAADILGVRDTSVTRMIRLGKLTKIIKDPLNARRWLIDENEVKSIAHTRAGVQVAPNSDVARSNSSEVESKVQTGGIVPKRPEIDDRAPRVYPA